jgi:hypothetical protein
MEGLIGQGQARLRAAEAGSATADVLSSNTAQALSNGSQPAYENSFETDDELSIGLESGVVSGSGALDSGRARARARSCRWAHELLLAMPSAKALMPESPRRLPRTKRACGCAGISTQS